MPTPMRIPRDIIQAIASFGATVDVNCLPTPDHNYELDCMIAAPQGKVWETSRTHDLHICCCLPPGSAKEPMVLDYFDGLRKDMSGGLVDCDAGKSAGTQDSDTDKCERCDE